MRILFILAFASLMASLTATLIHLVVSGEPPPIRGKIFSWVVASVISFGFVSLVSVLFAVYREGVV